MMSYYDGLGAATFSENQHQIDPFMLPPSRGIAICEI